MKSYNKVLLMGAVDYCEPYEDHVKFGLLVDKTGRKEEYQRLDCIVYGYLGLMLKKEQPERVFIEGELRQNGVFVKELRIV